MATQGPPISQQIAQSTDRVRKPIAAIGMLLIAIVALVIAVVIGLRLFGVPVQWVTVPQDVTGTSIFLLCAAYALGKSA